ncbi:hypothetical protein E4U33_006966 [Claviceps sp. LM78 group G4]|nr:hypothetical protein E4U33_006966 [Claviceps sp. LM78 group G4]
MTCYRRGKPSVAGESSVSRKRRGAVSQRTDCKMKFWLVANDYTQLDGQWRVKWCKNRASISHNHPPAPSVKSIASHRRATRTDDMRLKLQSIWHQARDATQALLLVQRDFPDAILTRQDLVNEYRRWQSRELGTRTRVQALFDKMDAKNYWYSMLLPAQLYCHAGIGNLKLWSASTSLWSASTSMGVPGAPIEALKCWLLSSEVAHEADCSANLALNLTPHDMLVRSIVNRPRSMWLMMALKIMQRRLLARLRLCKSRQLALLWRPVAVVSDDPCEEAERRL